MENIIVTTTSERLADSVFATKLDGVELSLLLRKSWDPASAERIFYIGVTVSSSVAINLFSSWLWDVINKHRANKTEINGQGCPNSEAEIAAMIERIVKESKQAESEAHDGDR